MKIKNVLVSQPKPETEKSPYFDLAKKYNLKIDFHQFIKVVGISSKDFRKAKINILEHQAVILNSKNAVDHFFRMCTEMRINVPETMKYFCVSEAIANYLQKYIVYRKRKIFFGQKSLADITDVLKKHKDDHYLLPCSNVHKDEITDILDDLELNYSRAVMYKTVNSDLSKTIKVTDYDLLVFFTPAGIKSLFKNFPKFKQGKIKIAAFGESTAKAVAQAGLKLSVLAPNPKAPSMPMALDLFIKEENKKA